MCPTYSPKGALALSTSSELQRALPLCASPFFYNPQGVHAVLIIQLGPELRPIPTVLRVLSLQFHLEDPSLLEASFVILALTLLCLLKGTD